MLRYPNMIEINLAEILPVIIYLISLLFLGFRKQDRSTTESDYILGGRQLTLPSFIATLVTTWYGGILGVGEFTYRYGFSNWLVFGFPYYIFAILFAFFMAPKIQSSQFLSIPDQFYKNYGKTGGYLGTFYTFFMTLPAPYILMVGLFIQMISGWSLWISIIVGTFFSMIYVSTGGFRAVVRTDKLQFLLMFGGFTILLVYLIANYGGIRFLHSNLPSQHLSLTGGNSWAYIFVWFFIGLWTFIDPGFHQRCYAARSPKTARNGILISVGFWFIFDFLTTSTGLYARALLRDINPVLSFPLLSHNILPPLLSGLFITGILATIMSTVDSLTLLSGITIGYDFWKKVTKRKIDSLKILKFSMYIAALISIILSILIPSVIQIWYLVGSLFIPPMLLPLLACYYPYLRPGRKWVVLNLTIPFASSFIFLIISLFQSTSILKLNYFLNIQPMYPGLITSLLVFCGGIIKKRVGMAIQNS